LTQILRIQELGAFVVDTGPAGTWIAGIAVSIRNIDMKASVNSLVTLLSNDGLRGKGPVRRTTEKPQQRFADVPVLAGIVGQAKPDKNGTGKLAAGAGAQNEQGTSEPHKRNSRAVPDGSEVVVVATLSDQQTGMSASATRESAKGDLVPSASLKKASAQSTGVKKTSTKVTDDATAVTSTGAAAAAVDAPRAPRESAVRPIGGTPAVHLNKAKAENTQTTPVAKSERAETGRQTPEKPRSEERGAATADATPSSESTESRSKEQAAVAKSSVENAPRAKPESTVAAATGGADVALPVQPLLKEHSAGLVEKPGETSAKAQAVRRASVGEAPERPERTVSGARWESQPAAASKREVTSSNQNAKAEGTQPGSKEVQAAGHKEGTTVPGESLVSFAGPSAAVTHGSVETPTPVSPEVASKSPVGSVREQILDSVQASVAQGDREILIRLQPPELGTVTVRLQEQGEHLEGTIEVSKIETRREIEQALPEVMRSLQDAGIQIRKLDVTSNDASGQDLGRGQTQQDLWSGQHNSGQSREHTPASHTPWSQANTDYRADSPKTSSEARRTNLPSGGIDMLL
jgi:flagellar hook-length control protein FliK